MWLGSCVRATLNNATVVGRSLLAEVSNCHKWSKKEIVDEQVTWSRFTDKLMKGEGWTAWFIKTDKRLQQKML